MYLGCRTESSLYPQLLAGSQVQLLAMPFSGKFDKKTLRLIRDAVHTYQIQLINAQSSKDRYLSMFARWLYRLPVKVVHTRRQTPASVGGFLQSYLYTKGTDKIVAVSGGVKKELVTLGLPPSHIEVIYNGTPRQKFEQADLSSVPSLRQQYGIQEQDFVIGCVSRRKKQEQLLLALHYIEAPVKVILVGIEDAPDLQQLRQGYPVAHQVFFTGTLPNAEVLAHYPLFDVHVLCSTTEGLSQSLLEAMAMEVAVVATRASGNDELIEDGKSGLLFEDRSPEQLAKTIVSLKDQPLKRKALALAGKQRALRTFSIENTILNYETFFLRLINS